MHRDRRWNALEAYTTKRGRLTQRAPATVETVPKIEVSKQTSNTTRDASTRTWKPTTTSRGCGTQRKDRQPTEAQTDDPLFSRGWSR